MAKYFPSFPALNQDSATGSRTPLLRFFLLLGAALLLAALAPVERTLGVNARLVYLHGAWVWVAMFIYLAATLAGLTGLITRRSALHTWSRALGRSGLIFWLAFLLMSLYVMQANWNGLYLDEPRFRLPLNYAIVSLLLQVGLSFFPNPVWTSWANLGFGIALFTGMSGMQAVLHPDSPIFNSQASGIQLFFVALLALLLAAAWQLAHCWLMWSPAAPAHPLSNPKNRETL